MIVRKIFEEKFKKYNIETSFFNINIPKNRKFGDLSTDFLISLKDRKLREEILAQFKNDVNFEQANIV
ncbi:MAG: hypothetical protein ACUVQN_06015, partial [Caldisericia bacterium]